LRLKLNEGHTERVSSIVLFENFLFSSGLDSTAREWDKTTGVLLRVFTTSISSQVSSVAVSEDGQFLFTGTIIAGSYIIQWRILDGSIVRTLDGHSTKVTVVKISNEHLFSGDGSGLIIQYSIPSGTIERKYSFHSDAIFDLLIIGDTLISISSDTFLIKWIISSGELQLSGEAKGSVLSLTVVDDLIFCGVLLDSFSKYDFENLKFIDTVKGLCLRPIKLSRVFILCLECCSF
jgi:WD40 repeat protein